jgi:SHS2 domain-containing protein
MPLKFEPFEHTADVGITAYGKTLPELLENAAAGMYSFITNPPIIKPAQKEKLSAKGIDNESLLINWLNKLLYLTSIKRIIFSEFKVVKYGEYFIDAVACGEKIDPQKHPLDTEIKAATYSGLKINKTAEGYSVQIIFDV